MTREQEWVAKALERNPLVHPGEVYIAANSNDIMRTWVICLLALFILRAWNIHAAFALHTVFGRLSRCAHVFVSHEIA